jgi:hypothetical protein
VVSTDIVAKTAPEKSQQLIRWLESFLNEEVGTPVAA